MVYGTLYSSYIYKSVNGGLTFNQINGSEIPESDFFHTPFEMDPHNSQKIFTASGLNTVYYSDDAGENWNSVPVELGSNKILKIRVSKADSNIVWAASTSEFINYSTDAGDSYSTITRPAGTPTARLTGMETHPSDSATALITFGIYGSGKIFRTENLGISWEDMTNNLPDVPVHCALIMPHNTDEIWIGTDIGVFISTDNGQSWSYSDNGLPAVSVRRLKIVNQEIVAVTHGRGIWSLHNDQLPKIVVPLDIPILADLNYPNPNTHQLQIDFMARGDYDSLLIQLNDATIQTLTRFPVYQDTLTIIPVSAATGLTIRIVGVKNNQNYQSDLKTIHYYQKIDTLDEDFESEPVLFSGDFEISQESGFESATLHTNHNYDDQREYISVLETPVKIYSDSYLFYRDVAIVEPGEEGKFYPDIQMWDYITVEGSADGVNWEILILPYDCRFFTAWQTAYESSNPGNSTMFDDHEIKLAEYYPAGTIIYLRFRLYADEAANGWGWAIDDVEIASEEFTTLHKHPAMATEFKLLGNYPNPFNPGTTIRFTLEQTGPVQLDIYNNLGQRIKTIIDNKEYQNGKIHRAYWDGSTSSGSMAASGTYYYRLISGQQSQVKKMILLR
ncbi:MAG: T9SS type A sorting domain-containing protein [Calditrichaceae bacterium]|nr:T9SS type A sorting domain-containing protein [Calditrichaceae bacterium]